MTNNPKNPGGGSPDGATGDLPQAVDSLWQGLFQKLYDGAIITDSAGVILDANVRALSILLVEKADICGHPVSDCISGVDGALIETALRNLAEQRFTQIEGYCLRKDGSVFPGDVVVGGLQHNDQKLLCFFIRDITRRKATEEQLLRDKAEVEEQLLRIKEAVQKHAQFLETLFTAMPSPVFRDSFSAWNKQFVHHLKKGPYAP